MRTFLNLIIKQRKRGKIKIFFGEIFFGLDIILEYKYYG
jgi:hypothetical protein